MLGEVGDVVLADLARDRLLAAVRDVDVLWVRLRHRVDAEVMAAGPRLRAIASPTTGLNHVDLVEAERRGIAVYSLRGESEFLRDVRATAEHTLALILALLRHLPAAAAHAARGGWDRTPFQGRDLQGKTLGIVGLGRIGRLVARYLLPFDVTILAADRGDAWPVDTPSGVTPVPLAELLRRADLVTLHASCTPETVGLIGRGELAAMKPGAWLVNTARGELVDEEALLDALRSGRLRGAALDVLREERSEGMAHHPLVAYAREHDNLIITPHIGGFTTESLNKTELFLARKLREGLATCTV